MEESSEEEGEGNSNGKKNCGRNRGSRSQTENKTKRNKVTIDALKTYKSYSRIFLLSIPILWIPSRHSQIVSKLR